MAMHQHMSDDASRQEDQWQRGQVVPAVFRQQHVDAHGQEDQKAQVQVTPDRVMSR
jgi:hypothetical protein